MNKYPAIEDHGLIGDLQTAALVASDGTIDWFCAPRFDSPAIFASLLDQQKGGRFRICPIGDVERAGNGVQVRMTLSVGDVGGMVLETQPGSASRGDAGCDRADVRPDSRVLA